MSVLMNDKKYLSMTELKKTFNGGSINIAKDCNETGIYFLNGVTAEDPFGPYIDHPTTAFWCVVKTIWLSSNFKYQEAIWDGGKFYRGTYNGDDHYTPWMAEVWVDAKLEDLLKRVSTLEKQIGGGTK